MNNLIKTVFNDIKANKMSFKSIKKVLKNIGFEVFYIEI